MKYFYFFITIFLVVQINLFCQIKNFGGYDLKNFDGKLSNTSNFKKCYFLVIVHKKDMYSEEVITRYLKYFHQIIKKKTNWNFISIYGTEKDTLQEYDENYLAFLEIAKKNKIFLNENNFFIFENQKNKFFSDFIFFKTQIAPTYYYFYIDEKGNYINNIYNNSQELKKEFENIKVFYRHLDTKLKTTQFYRKK